MATAVLIPRVQRAQWSDMWNAWAVDLDDGRATLRVNGEGEVVGSTPDYR